MNKPISKAMMARLQVLYSQLAAHTDQGADRAARLAWASALVRPNGPALASFKELSSADAAFLIDTLQGQLGVQAPAPPRRRLDRDAARKAGTEGRRGYRTNELTMASAADIARVDKIRERIGWSREQFDAWLRSQRSPLQHRSSPRIISLGDANQVWWALKRIAKRMGKWERR
jgi:hypothetical protein